jgi:dTDP-4-amino-4,6-dideoxygalactose transaminase
MPIVSRAIASRPQSFDQPLLHAQPLLPDLGSFARRLERVWGARTLTNGGPQLQELETRLAETLEASRLLLCANGTIALMLALKALDLEGEVVTTPFTFAATPHSITWAGLTPVFADIDPSSFNLDPSAVEAAITPNTSAILAVHVFGNVCNVAALQDIASRHGLRLVYDAAHAFGARIAGMPVSQFGDAVVFSLHATKLFHSAEGGAVVARDEGVLDRIGALRNFGIQGHQSTHAGLNGKMSEIHAAMGLEVLALISDERAARKRVAEIYRSRLGAVPGVSLPPRAIEDTDSYQYFPVLIHSSEFGLSRNELLEKLLEFNVHARRYFYPLCSEFPTYRHLPSSRPRGLPVATRVVENVMCLPYYGSLADENAHRLCDVIAYSQETA